MKKIFFALCLFASFARGVTVVVTADSVTGTPVTPANLTSTSLPTNITGVTSITGLANTSVTFTAGSGNKNLIFVPTGTGGSLFGLTTQTATGGTNYPVEIAKAGSATSTDTGTLSLLSTTAIASAANVGAAIGFGGYYTGTTHGIWSRIRGPKLNGTDGNYSGYLAFDVRTSGAAPFEAGRFDYLGNFLVGTAATLTGTGQIALAGDLIFDTVGKTVSIKSGTNGLSGTVTLTGGAATITSSAITTSMVIVLTVLTPSGTIGDHEPSKRVFNGSATIQGSSSDNSTYNWAALRIR